MAVLMGTSCCAQTVLPRSGVSEQAVGNHALECVHRSRAAVKYVIYSRYSWRMAPQIMVVSARFIEQWERWSL
jgi:hypothetical protein